MADKTPIIALRLEGALQSWGDHSKWDERDSGNFPTKSGVVGLIACAMGLSRENEKVVDLTRSFQMAVRADRPGTRIIDFNTVMGNPLYTAGGKRPQSASTIVSHRCFLEDASFLALIEPSPEWIRLIIDSLKSPKWPIYLGRKSCVPSRPVLECVTEDYLSLADALTRFPLCERSAAGEYIRYESDFPMPGASSYTRSDLLSSADRNFSKRTVYTGVIRKEA